MELHFTFAYHIHNTNKNQQIEAPQEINCLQRFNIHQEVVIAALYRAVNSFGFLRVGHIDPSTFYVGCLFALWAFGVVCMFVAAFLGSGRGWRGIGAGITVVALAYANVNFWTRIWNHPPLRENFGMPFVLLQVTHTAPACLHGTHLSTC